MLAIVAVKVEALKVAKTASKTAKSLVPGKDKAKNKSKDSKEGASSKIPKASLTKGASAMGKTASKAAAKMSGAASKMAYALENKIGKKKPVPGACHDSSKRSDDTSSDSSNDPRREELVNRKRPDMRFTGTGMRVVTPKHFGDKFIEMVKKCGGDGSNKNSNLPFHMLPILREENLDMSHAIFQAAKGGLDQHVVSECLGAILVGYNEEYINSIEQDEERRHFVRGIEFQKLHGELQEFALHNGLFLYLVDDFSIKPLRRENVGAFLTNVYKIFLVSPSFSKLEYKSGALQPYREMEREGVEVHIFE